MSVVTFPTVKPYTQVAVNSTQVFAAIVDPQAPDVNSELLVDAAGGRSILVVKPILNVGADLGGAFVRMQTAAVSPSTCYVNKAAWVSILPHPQQPGVCQVFGQNRYVAVQGDIQSVSALLS
nr:hypothetical protein [uncultured Dongia sp.]